MRLASIARHRHIWPVSWLCKALEVSRWASMRGSHAQPVIVRLMIPALFGRSSRASKPAIALMARAGPRSMNWRDVLEEGVNWCGGGISAPLDNV